LAVFAGIAVGVARIDGGTTALLLGASAILGGLLSFTVVLRGMLLPNRARNPKLQQIVDGATSRDFSVLVLFLALLDKLSWFLWVTAICVHLFWIAALLVQIPKSRQTEPGLN